MTWPTEMLRARSRSKSSCRFSDIWMYFVSVKYPALETATRAPENDTFSTFTKLYEPSMSLTVEAINSSGPPDGTLCSGIFTSPTLAPAIGILDALTTPDKACAPGAGHGGHGTVTAAEGIVGVAAEGEPELGNGT